MATVPPNQLAKDISAGRFASSYYFYGTEDFRINEAEKHVARTFLSERQLTTNYRRIDGRRMPIADLLAELSVYPMLGERQVFVITSFQSYKPKEIERVGKLLTPPDSNRIIVFSSPAAKSPSKKSVFYKNMLSMVDTIVEFPRLKPAQVAKRLRSRLKEAGLSIDADAESLFVGLVAGNRGALDAEIDKLLHFKGEDRTISLDDVSRVCSGFVVYDIFELADAVVSGDKRRVLHMLDRLMAGGDVSGGLLFNLGQHFTFLYLARQGKPLPGNRSWLTGKFRSQAEQFSSEELERFLIKIAETTASIRRAEIKPRLGMEMLVLSLMERVS
jgi:DNA polymerase III delta subunit